MVELQNRGNQLETFEYLQEGENLALLQDFGTYV